MNERLIKLTLFLNREPFGFIALTILLLYLIYLVLSNNDPVAANSLPSISTYELVSNPNERIQQFYNGISEKRIYSNNAEDGVTLYLIKYFKIKSGALFFFLPLHLLFLSCTF